MFKAFIFPSGVNREGTRYSRDNRWFDCDKVRFRQGLPEKIGGWENISNQTFLGVCRALFNWTTLSGANLVGIGTHLKYYVEQGGIYYDITPERSVVVLGNNPFSSSNGSTNVTVTHSAHGARDGDFVTFSNMVPFAGLDLNGEFEIEVINANSYRIQAPNSASSTTSGGGSAVNAGYQISIGNDILKPLFGYSAGPYGFGPYGIGEASEVRQRLWSQANFGQNLVFNYRGGPLFYWDATTGVGARGIFLSDLPGADDVPLVANYVLVSDFSRFVFAFGCDGSGGGNACPMRIRWSDQENVGMWRPSPLNQAGEIRLSKGTEIVTALQSRQEILVWTDAALYSLQFLGAPEVWGSQLVGEGVSILSPNSAAHSNGVTYWIGRNTFYRYDGTVTQLDCDLLQYVFDDFNFKQKDQVFAGKIERFNEIWWFYPSKNSLVVDKYVVYNHKENSWYHGNMSRTAWLDSQQKEYPMATTYNGKLLFHEVGCDDLEQSEPVPIKAFIETGDFSLEDGDRYMFIRKMLPDVSFVGSTANNPHLNISLTPRKDAGAPRGNPASVGGKSEGNVSRSKTVPVEEFTEQVNVRLRGRQMSMRIESDGLGVAWQLGKPRFDIKPDGKRG